MLMLDTSVAILLRDKDSAVTARLAGTSSRIVLPVVARVELESGLHKLVQDRAKRQARLTAIYANFETLDFDAKCADEYGKIVSTAGYSRRKMLDRMIAAQALVHGATLATKNPGDFADVPGLAVEPW